MENEFCASVACQGALCTPIFNTPVEKGCANNEEPLALQNSFPLLLALERMTKEDMKAAPETTPVASCLSVPSPPHVSDSYENFGLPLRH